MTRHEVIGGDRETAAERAPRGARRLRGLALDIDGTLTEGDYYPLILRALGMRDEAIAVFFRNLRGSEPPEMDYHRVRADLMRSWPDRERATRELMEGIFRYVPFRPEASRLVGHARALGWPICLITASMDVYARAIARRLGIGDWYSGCSARFDADGRLADIVFEPDPGQAKCRHLSAFCRRRGLTPGEVLVVGDSEHDLGLFAGTDNGVLVRRPGNEPLATYAWRTVDHLDEVIPLLPGGPGGPGSPDIPDSPGVPGLPDVPDPATGQ
ncbi:HAD family hydrolase [Bailinhaonella thermotolerans]|uniref:HAD family hydrolase n=1 Tax=Bailinhaonella thermotolerans TaxID=1070861 RepID=UPI00192A1D90|nr:HAD-IB family phosphatase [Bailinhaonella thermotolerans]